MRTVTLLLVGWVLLAGKARAEEAKPLPEDVVKAWQKAGAPPGWMGPHRKGSFAFTRKRENLDAKRAVPAFRFDEWSEGAIANLPAPASAFGIDLEASGANDAALKELAG